MNSIKIKNKIAQQCDGNLKKYFNLVEKVNFSIANKHKKQICSYKKNKHFKG